MRRLPVSLAVLHTCVVLLRNGLFWRKAAVGLCASQMCLDRRLDLAQTREWLMLSVARSTCSYTAELRVPLGDEGRDSLFRVIRAAGRDDRFFFSIELIRQAGLE